MSAPPSNLGAEDNVLGALLLSPRAFEGVLETGLAWTDFYRETNGRIFLAATRMFDQGQPVDAVTLAEQLSKTGELAKVGGPARLIELAALVPAVSNIDHYARIVKEASTIRAVIRAGQKIQQIGMERSGDLDEVMAAAEAALLEATQTQRVTDFASIADGLEEMAAAITKAVEEGIPRFGLASGYADLDKITTGFYPGQLCLMAARPSMGKSALAQCVSENIADQGATVGFVSLEMSKEEVALRSLSRASRIPSDQLRTAQLPIHELGEFRKGLEKVKGRHSTFFVEDDASMSVSQLKAKAKKLARQSDLKLLVVDYLGLMVGAGREDNRQAEIAQISRSLKILARELHIPVIALSQLNRSLESRQEKRPVLSDLRDSGALEQDADIVLFIYRDDYYNPMSENGGVAEVIVSKNRNGGLGTAHLSFVKRYTDFRSIPKLKEAA